MRRVSSFLEDGRDAPWQLKLSRLDVPKDGGTNIAENKIYQYFVLKILKWRWCSITLWSVYSQDVCYHMCYDTLYFNTVALTTEIGLGCSHPLTRVSWGEESFLIHSWQNHKLWQIGSGGYCGEGKVRYPFSFNALEIPCSNICGIFVTPEKELKMFGLTASKIPKEIYLNIWLFVILLLFSCRQLHKHNTGTFRMNVFFINQIVYCQKLFLEAYFDGKVFSCTFHLMGKWAFKRHTENFVAW